MEFVDGTTLRELVKSGHRFTPERAVEITEGTLTALDYSHRHGIIHRDVKPGNVMLNRTGQVKVMDFGIARAIADSAATMTQTSAVLGTAQYLSPEQARGEVVDARSDQYSTGCLLFELLTGRPPFIGDSPVSVAYQHVREAPASPSTLNPDVPPAVDAVVMKSLQKSPADRYDTAAAMRDDLERARLGEPLVGAAVPAIGEAGVSGAPLGPAGVPLTAGYLAGEATQLMAPVLPGTIPATATLPPSNRSRVGWYVLLGVAVVAVGVLAFFVLRGLFGGTDANISVPDLSGLTHSQVVSQLTDHGLKLGTEQQAVSDVTAGEVISQDPAKGAKVASGTVVNVTYSSGPQQVPVPTLVGLSKAQAIDALLAAGLQVGTITLQDSSGQAAGTVLKAAPAEGTSVAKGSAVALIVSSGNVKVPTVLGELQAQATADLSNAGFQVQVIDQLSTAVADGTVTAQNPKGGTLLQQNKTVIITVAKAPPPTSTPTTSASGSPTGSSSPTP
jgi:serine/threonine-protein kinase